MKTLIYALIDPRTKLVRYIGQTCQGLRRAEQHGQPWILRRVSYVTNWIKALHREGLDYEVTVLEYTDDLDTAEHWWIVYGRALGWPLTNLTSGGDSTRRFTQSAETRAKMSASHKGLGLGRKLSLETRSKISARTKEAMTPAIRANLAEQKRKDWQNPAYRTLVTAGRRDRVLGDKNPSKRPEVRAKLSAAAKLREARRRGNV